MSTLFMHSYTLRVCLFLVDYINTTFSTVSSTAYKNGAQVRKNAENYKQSRVHA